MDFLDSVFSFFSGLRFSGLNVSNTILVLGLILLLGSASGCLFKKLKLPQVVGYIVVGILTGLSGVRIFGQDVLQSLAPISSLALSLIGFLIGSELKFDVIKKYGRQFLGILIFESIVPFFTVGILVTLVSWLVTGNFSNSLALGVVLGAISSATAPAATTDVLAENRSKGPLTTILLGIVAMDDAVALFLFAAASSVASGLIGAARVSFTGQLLGIGYKIFVSIGAGIAVGFILNLILSRIKNDDGRSLCFALGSIMAATGGAAFFNLDTILVAMACGCMIVNTSSFSTAQFFKNINKFTPPVYILFFVLVGANLNLRVITPLFAVIAVIYVLARTFGKSIGSSFGAKITGAPATVRKYMRWCLLSQAGVAIGLSISASTVFAGSELGNTVPLVITATTFIVQMIGPVCVKYGITKAGEAGLDITEEDLLRSSTVQDVLSIIPESKIGRMVLDTTPFSGVIDSFGSQSSLSCPVADVTGRFSGIITIEHLKEAIALGSSVSESLLAYDIMDPSPVVCSPETPVSKVKELFRLYQVDSIPVVSSSGKFLGLVETILIEKFFHMKVLELSSKAAALEKK